MITPKARKLAEDYFSAEVAKQFKLEYHWTNIWSKRVYLSAEEQNVEVEKRLMEISSPIWEVVESILDCPEDLEKVEKYAYTYKFSFGKVLLTFHDGDFGGMDIYPRIYNTSEEIIIIVEAYRVARKWIDGQKQREILKGVFSE